MEAIANADHDGPYLDLAIDGYLDYGITMRIL